MTKADLANRSGSFSVMVSCWNYASQRPFATLSSHADRQYKWFLDLAGILNACQYSIWGYYSPCYYNSIFKCITSLPKSCNKNEAFRGNDRLHQNKLYIQFSHRGRSYYSVAERNMLPPWNQNSRASGCPTLWFIRQWQENYGSFLWSMGAAMINFFFKKKLTNERAFIY